MNKDNKDIQDQEVLDLIEQESREVTPEEVDEVIVHEEEIREKSEKLNKDKFGKLYNQVKLALQMVKDYKAGRYREIPWRTIGLLTVGVLYFLNPFDLMPDLIPLLGLTDDAVALAAIFKSIQSDLKLYCEWRGLNLNDYF